MNANHTLPADADKHERYETAGFVVTRGCRYRPEVRRWEPQVSIEAAHDAGAAPIQLTAEPEAFQDTPEDAMTVATRMASAWLDQNRRSDPTPDAAA